MGRLQLENTSSERGKEKSTNGKADGVHSALGRQRRCSVTSLGGSLAAGRSSAGSCASGSSRRAILVITILIIIVLAGNNARLGGGGDLGVLCHCGLVVSAAEDVGVGGARFEEAAAEVVDGLVEGNAVDTAVVVVANNLCVATALLHHGEVTIRVAERACVVLVGLVVELGGTGGAGAGGRGGGGDGGGHFGK